MSTAIQRKKLKIKRKSILRYIGVSVGSLFSALIVSVMILLYGPFTQLHDLYVITVLETSAAKFLANAFLSDKAIAAVYERNRVEYNDEKTDPSLLDPTYTTGGTDVENTDILTPSTNVPTFTDATSGGQTADTTAATQQTAEPALAADEQFAKHPNAMSETDGLMGVQLVSVSGPTYNGYMLVISDPSRVSLCVSEGILNAAARGGTWWDSAYGQQLAPMLTANNAVAGINGGAFYDPNGNGNGGCPDGVLIYQGEMLYWGPEAQNKENWESVKVNVIGINKDNILILGQYTKAEVMELNLRDAVSFDNPDPPFLVLNGKESKVVGSGGSGIQPRTCIGQRSDKAFLFLVIDGRGAGGSLGATQKAATEILLEFGAINAANLDGGSSSELIVNGSTVSNPCSLIGPRYMPDGFMVQ